MNNTFGINGVGHTPETALELATITESNKFASAEEKKLFAFIRNWFDSSDTIVVNTSGSTGTPKTIELEKEKVKYSAQATVNFFGLERGMDVLLCLSTDYIAGKLQVVRAIEHGLNLVVSDVSSQPLMGLNKQINFAAMVPMQVQRSLDELNKVRKVIIGGAPVSYELERNLQKLSTQCWATYGMTETITHVALRKINGNDKSDFFTALPNVAFTVDERNCLCIVAPFIQEDAIQTNDLVELVDDKNFKWLGREDFVINSGGVKIQPEQVERKIQSLGDLTIGEFIVSSVPDPTLGEKLVLISEQQPNLELIQQLDSTLTKFEKPKEFFYGELSKTNSGKVNRIKARIDITKMKKSSLT